MIGVDDMKDAVEKGYLGGKYNIPKTFKFTHEMLDAIALASEINDLDSCSWVREVIAKALLAEDAKYERMTRVRERSKCTESTLVHQERISPVARTTELDCSHSFGGK